MKRSIKEIKESLLLKEAKEDLADVYSEMERIKKVTQKSLDRMSNFYSTYKIKHVVSDAVTIINQSYSFK